MKLQSVVGMRAEFLEAIGGEAGCRRLSAEFYARVGKDPVLRPLFPGKSLRCAIEEFGAFLIQFLGGDEEQTQHRWWLSLRESHARFRIGPAERAAWLKHMKETLDASPIDQVTREALLQFFSHSSGYIVEKETAGPEHEELAARWGEQRALDEVIAAIAAGHDQEALALAPRFAFRPSVFVGLLTRMIQSGRAGLIRFVINAVESDPSLSARRFSGKTLLHFASAAGCDQVVALLLRLGMDPNIQDRGGHTPLYCVANECGSETGPEVVRTLVRAGAEVAACGGVTRATPLHMAARRGRVEIARALLDSGAAVDARDSKGDTPLQRAIDCRKGRVRSYCWSEGLLREMFLLLPGLHLAADPLCLLQDAERILAENLSDIAIRIAFVEQRLGDFGQTRTVVHALRHVGAIEIRTEAHVIGAHQFHGMIDMVDDPLPADMRELSFGRQLLR